jgi:hypothetical protein
MNPIRGYMKLCAPLCLITLVCASALAQRVGAAIPDELTAWAQKYAASRKAGDGRTVDYYADGTMVSEGRLGGELAAALVFTLEGIATPNDYQQFLSVFWKRSGQFVFCCSRRVGGKGDRSVEKVQISGDSVRLDGKQYVPSTDALCCPSKSYVQRIKVEGPQLVVAPGRSN